MSKYKIVFSNEDDKNIPNVVWTDLDSYEKAVDMLVDALEFNLSFGVMNTRTKQLISKVGRLVIFGNTYTIKKIITSVPQKNFSVI